MLLVVCALLAATARAQQPILPGAPQDSQEPGNQTNTGTNGFGSAGAAGSSAANALPSETGVSTGSGIAASIAQVSLSSSQITQILQQNPDLIVELKSQVADRLQEQGVQIDANNISDEMLYALISTDASLRATITSFLSARGYVTQDDLAEAALTARDDAGGAFAPALPAAPGDAEGARLAAGSGLPGDASRFPDSTLAGTAGRSRSSASQPEVAEGERAHERTNASTDLPRVLRQPTPYNLQSLRDLYTQIPEDTPPLRRFGSDVFLNRSSAAALRGATTRDTPLEVPLGPDYVVGQGDTLTINLWGGTTQSLNRTVDRDGSLLLPEAGSLQVAGLTLEHVQQLVLSALQKQYRNVDASVIVSRLRSVRVYVVGDVQRPGGYDLSSLATPISALYAAGGPTAVGSLRILHHLRGKQVIEDIDLYDFLLHGLRGNSVHFESGDTLQVPPAGAQVAIWGAVRRPAIYELKGAESTLAALVEDAGGLTAAASLTHVTVEHIDNQHERETVTLNTATKTGSNNGLAAIASFSVHDGDRVRIAPILPYSQKVVYLEGHVVRPGRVPYTEGMRLSDVLHSYRDMLPEPAARGEIVRLVPPDLHPETLNFDVPEVLIGNENLALQPFDTIRLFGRYEADSPQVSVQGEVLRPGIYPLSDGMTAAQLVRVAGGLKRSALRESADLATYTVVGGNRVVSGLATVPIGAVLDGKDLKSDATLRPGDVLTIHEITGWNDIGQTITINGQVTFPGSYGFKEGERLSTVLRRAGGFRSTAYPEGAVLERGQVRELEEKSRDELIRQIEASSATARLSPNLAAGDSGAALQLIKAQQDEALAQLKSHPPTGRMVIQISADIDSWANTDADIELRRGDVLTIPKRPGFVLVTGQVYNATALTYTPGKTAAWYLSRAGGTNSSANHKDIFIVRANGSVVGRHSSGHFGGDVLSTKLAPGDVIVVPQKILGSSLLLRNLLTTAQFASSIAITAAVSGLL